MRPSPVAVRKIGGLHSPGTGPSSKRADGGSRKDSMPHPFHNYSNSNQPVLSPAGLHPNSHLRRVRCRPVPVRGVAPPAISYVEEAKKFDAVEALPLPITVTSVDGKTDSINNIEPILEIEEGYTLGGYFHEQYLFVHSLTQVPPPASRAFS